jgi:hypothetical protein
MHPDVGNTADRLAAAGCGADDVVICPMEGLRDFQILADLTVVDRSWRSLRLVVQEDSALVERATTPLEIWRAALDIAYDHPPVRVRSWHDALFIRTLQTR